MTCLLQLNHPNNSSVYFVDGMVSWVLSVSGETSRPNSFCISRLNITLGYGWKGELGYCNLPLYDLLLPPSISSLSVFLPSCSFLVLPPHPQLHFSLPWLLCSICTTWLEAKLIRFSIYKAQMALSVLQRLSILLVSLPGH